MKKVEKLKSNLLSKKPLSKRCKYIFKEKSITNTQKLRMVLNEYKKYFSSGEHRRAVMMEVYEMYYERFTIDGHVYETYRLPYEKLCDGDIGYFHFIDLLSNVNKLEFNNAELTKDEQQFVNFSKNFIQHFDNNKIDYSAFYYDKNFRDDIVKKMDAVFSFIKEYDYSKKENSVVTK